MLSVKLLHYYRPHLSSVAKIRAVVKKRDLSMKQKKKDATVKNGKNIQQRGFASGHPPDY
jgi:hypothetical protein